MTKLEEEIGKAILTTAWQDSKMQSIDEFAKAAAEVAKKYIEEAFNAGWMAINDAPYWTMDKEREEWLKENGIV